MVLPESTEETFWLRSLKLCCHPGAGIETRVKAESWHRPYIMCTNSTEDKCIYPGANQVSTMCCVTWEPALMLLVCSVLLQAAVEAYIP